MGNENTNTFPEWRLSTDLEYQNVKEKMADDSTGLTKDLYDQHRLEVYKRKYAHDPLKVSSTSEQQFPTATGDPYISQQTKDYFGEATETLGKAAQAIAVPTAIIGAKYLEGKIGAGTEYISNEVKKAGKYISATTKMPMNEIAHFLDSKDTQKFVNRIIEFEEKIAQAKIDKLPKKQITTLTHQLNTSINNAAKFLTSDHFKVYKKGLETQIPKAKDIYGRKGYNISVDQMKDILKNHKNWSIFKLKGEMHKDIPAAMKNFFKKGTIATKFGKDIVGWKVGQGIGDALYEFETPWVETGKDIATGYGGYKVIDKVIKQVPKMITNLSSKVKNFVMDGKTQTAVNKILKKRGAQAVASGTVALGTGPFAAAIEPIIGLVGIGLTINDIRKLFIGAEKDVAKLGIKLEDSLDKNVEEVLKKKQFPKNDKK